MAAMSMWRLLYGSRGLLQTYHQIDSPAFLRALQKLAEAGLGAEIVEMRAPDADPAEHQVLRFQLGVEIGVAPEGSDDAVARLDPAAADR